MHRYRSKIQLTLNLPEEITSEEFTKILDSIALAEPTSMTLERLGYTLEVSHDGGETWEKVQ
jgi:hypothetical protein